MCLQNKNYIIVMMKNVPLILSGNKKIFTIFFDGICFVDNVFDKVFDDFDDFTYDLVFRPSAVRQPLRCA